MTDKQLLKWCENQVKEMKKIRSELEIVLKNSQQVPDMMLLGGGASMNGVESAIGLALAQLDRMIKDASARAKYLKRKR